MNNWKTEFDKEFSLANNMEKPITPDRIKAFIERTLAEERKRVVGILETERDAQGCYFSEKPCNDCTACDARSTLVAAITKIQDV